MKLEIIVCMGSSCFSKGANKIVSIIEQYQNDETFDINIDMKGALCQGCCENGPLIIVDGQKYENVNEQTIIDILKQNLK